MQRLGNAVILIVSNSLKKSNYAPKRKGAALFPKPMPPLNSYTDNCDTLSHLPFLLMHIGYSEWEL